MPNRLEKDLIAQPELWSLVMQLSDTSLTAALLPPVDSEQMILSHIPLLTETAGSYAKAVEEAVYDNPLLLSDFSRITLLTASDRVALLPAGLDPEEAAAAFRATFGENAEATLMETTSRGPVVASEEDQQLLAFFRRTFFNITIRPTLAAMIETWQADGLWVSCEEGVVRVVYNLDGRLVTANSFPSTAPEDAAYYVAALRRVYGANRGTVFLRRAGASREACAVMADMLRGASCPVETVNASPAICRLGHAAADLPDYFLPSRPSA